MLEKKSKTVSHLLGINSPKEGLSDAEVSRFYPFFFTTHAFPRDHNHERKKKEFIREQKKKDTEFNSILLNSQK